MAGRPESWPASEVDGKVALIHGGDPDEGAKLAREFVTRGCRVVLVESSAPQFTRATQGGDPLPQFPVTCCAGFANEQSLDSVLRINLDVSAGEQTWSQGVEEAWRIFGSIDILVICNSVPATIKPFLETTEKDYVETMDINVKRSWKLSKAVARKMRETETRGSIIFLTSISGTERGTYPGISLYGTSMAAIHHLTKMMAMELGKYGIRVNAVSCGLSASNDLFKAKDGETVQEMARKVVPLQRWSSFPDDIMGVVLWLAGDLSTFVTGTISVVDGGQSISRPRLTSYL